MKGKSIFTHGMTGEGVIGDPPVDTRHGPKTKSFGYQVLGFGSGGGPSAYNVQYLVVAGGGAGNNYYGGAGGGAGGFRTIACKTLEVEKGVTYPIQVGAGGPSAPAPVGDSNPVWPTRALERAGEPSIFSTITSAGGGAGGAYYRGGGFDGGSGGGSGSDGSGPTTPPGPVGAGNVPPTCPPQGNPGGYGDQQDGGGGGGHTAVGGAANPNQAGTGGAGTADGIRGTPFDPVAYAGGGGGGAYATGTLAAGGDGGGGSGGYNTTASTGGGTNTGGGSGGAGGQASGCFPTQPGGPGIVIIRRLTACSSTTSGTNTTCGCDTIHTFTGDGTFVA